MSEDPQTHQFTVSVYVEVAKPPVLKKGKTSKGNKYVKQPSTAEGPFIMLQKMKWEDFLDQVAHLAEIDKENIDATITSMTWSFQKKNRLPLTGVSSFNTMVQQIRVLKDPESAIILVALLAPRCRPKEQVIMNENNLEGNDRHYEDTSLFGRKVCLSATLDLHN